MYHELWSDFNDVYKVYIWIKGLFHSLTWEGEKGEGEKLIPTQTVPASNASVSMPWEQNVKLTAASATQKRDIKPILLYHDYIA